MRRPLLAYLVSHPIQYQAPLFRRLAASKEIDFVALFGCDFGVRPSYDPQFGQVVDFGVDLLGGYRSVFFQQGAGNGAIDRFLGLRLPAAQMLWDTEPFDVITLHGWRTAMMWQAAAGALLRKRPYLMRAETPLFARNGAPAGLMKRAKNVAVRTLVNGSAGALALGTANERFYLQLGHPQERLYRVPYFVDNEAVSASSREGLQNGARIRAELGIPGDAFVVIAVGKLMPRKRPFDIVRTLPMLDKSVHLLWVGSGEMEDAVRAEAVSLGVSDRVHLAGFRAAAETWRLMGASDLFVLPAENEPWGLVINEAVVAGLPAVVSDECGAAEDLIVPQRTGDIVRVGDLPAWASAIRNWHSRATSGDRGDLVAMKGRADAHSIDRAAAGIEEAVAAVTSEQQ